MEQIGRSGEPGRTHRHGLAVHALQLVGGAVEQAGRPGVGHGVEDHQVAQALQHVGREPPRVVPPLHHLVEQAEDAGCVVGREGVDDAVEQRGGGDAEQRCGSLAGDSLRAGGGEHLVEDRQAVAGRTRGSAYDQR